MPGSKTNNLTLDQVRAAVGALSAEAGYVWDGVDEDDRPLTEAELQTARRNLEHPSDNAKTEIALRVDNDVLAAFRASGAGWQNRMNSALKDWLKTHSPTSSSGL